jgi:V8-like Glu-specific endopeptidase
MTSKMRIVSAFTGLDQKRAMFYRRALSATLAFAAIGCVGTGIAQAEDAQVRSANGNTVFQARETTGSNSLANAKPMALPTNAAATSNFTQEMIQALTATPDLGARGGEAGSRGSGGGENPVFVDKPDVSDDGVGSEDFGTNNHPFTTARADLFTVNTNKTYPYRAAGILTFCNGCSNGNNNFYCTASTVKPGVIVAAAHCVANFGKKTFYNNWKFYPAYRNGTAPYGIIGVKYVVIKTSYYNGTDSCAQSGVICQNDVAVLVLNRNIGNTIGWFGYWYGGGFTSNGLEEITQLGYPSGLDSGLYMERTDSQGYTNSSLSNNTIIGSNMNGGSSGGPWVANFGLPSALTGETNGSFPQQNVVIGVTSWGYISNSPKEQGASPFTSNNIQSLLYGGGGGCTVYPGNC